MCVKERDGDQGDRERELGGAPLHHLLIKDAGGSDMGWVVY